MYAIVVGVVVLLCAFFSRRALLWGARGVGCFCVCFSYVLHLSLSAQFFEEEHVGLVFSGGSVGYAGVELVRAVL